MRDARRVLIVGGGIAGATLAVALSRVGIASDLVELNGPPAGSGIGLSASALRLLHRLDLAQDVVAKGHPMTKLVYCDPTGRTLVEIAYPAILPDGLPPHVTISRAALTEVLFGAARRCGTDVMEGTTLTGCTEGADAIVAHLSNGESRAYDLIVGADGAYSSVRAQVFGEHLKPRFMGQGVWRKIAPNETGLVEGRFLRRGTVKVGVFPVSKEEIYIVMGDKLESPEWQDPALQHIRMLELLEGFDAPFLGSVRDGLATSDGVVYRPLTTFFLSEPWHRGRVALIGDAAHSTTPHLSAGGVMAVEDAWVLADELSEGTGLESALPSFMSRRLKRVQYIQEKSELLSRLEQSETGDSPDYKTIRGEALKVLAEPV